MSNFMKFMSLLCLVLAVSMIFSPLISLKSRTKETLGPTLKETTTVSSGTLKTSKISDVDMKIKRISTGKVEKISMFDYIVGNVSAEISPLYNEEAIKAQAVAAHTYALYRIQKEKDAPTDDLDGAYLSDDYTKYQGYMSAEEMKKKWGDNYDIYADKIKECVEAVRDKIITYNGALIEPAYFAYCSGKTESAKNVFGNDRKYLQSVISTGDSLCPDLISTKKFTKTEFEKCAENLENCKLGDNAAEWIGDMDTSPIGTVLSMSIGSGSYKGSVIQSTFDLKSNNFTVKYAKETFTFTVKGSGHSVGMSQYGADYMARQGSTYDEILMHYYTGTAITSIS